MRKFLSLVTLLFLPLCAFGQTADDIIAKYVEARGGLAQIKAVQSERVTGSIVFAPNVQGAFVVERERPMKMHMEITLSGMMMIRTYDGKSSGWTYNPSGDNPAVMPMTETDLRNILDEADFEGPFIDYKAKGNHVEFAGKTTVEGKPAYKIKLTNKNGDVSYFSFDANSYMLLRFQGTLKRENKDLATESFFRDFREVAGLQYPFVIESVSPDTGDTQKILADKIEVNVAIPESHFAKPSTPPAATAPAAAPPTAPAEAPKPN